MIGRVVAHELRTASRDGRVRGLLVLLLAVLAIAVLVGVVRSRTLRSEHAAATAIERDNWLAQGEKNPHSAAHYGQFAFKPPSALALFDRGVDSYLGVAVWLEAHRRNSLVHRPADDAPVVQRFGELSAANVLQVLGPLLALLLTFAAVAGERQRGTLRQLLAQGASPATLVLGKLLAALLLLAPMLLAALFVPAVLAARADDGLAPVGLLVLAYGLYLGSFAALGVAISTRARDPGGALVSALGVWIAMVIVVPRLAADFTAWSSPTPSEHDFSAQVAREIKEGINGHDPRDKRTEALKAAVLAEYGVKTIEELPINFAGVALQAGEEYSDQVHDRHHAQLHAIYREQADEALRFAVLSPRVALQPLSAALCGTDLAAHLEFAADAEAHRRALVRLLNDDVTRHPGAAPFDYLAGPELWRRVAELRWEPGQRSAGRASPRHLLILAGFFAASVTLVLAAARRLRIDP